MYGLKPVPFRKAPFEERRFGAGVHCRSLGFARDDKGEGGDFCEEPFDRMDRKKQQDKVRLNSATSRKKSIKSQPPTSATLRSGRDDKGEGGDVY